ncbi:Slp family lipoprotein [endosymbiont of Ridgeia piscesae]|uniref:Outer membrane lipoprotein n=1 Tax=endosymbiont of Ridgeia piscesae TaxID=54398 RepID=A0A0T5YX96_9GAMM|nr:Slp family lipoprotein [endosymbiont of Ridgeia piscesae]KRT54846.1 Starvation-inducible outer membrane lipoprotein [endosymbiont of Ridgeia piscesae]KRT58942.1 outer membrane lipoprotein [endosymbiont of Ridgeia piscesae]
MKSLLIICLFASLTCCAQTPTRPPAADRSITPRMVVDTGEQYLSHQVEWGGVIVESRNLRQNSELQVLAYPLDTAARPDLDQPPNGRFIVVSPGYLENVDYAKGRQVTLSGRISALRPGKVGEADYLFPVVDSSEIELWPEQSRGGVTPRFNFGISGGSGGRIRTGVGVGIQF